ncbi:hypothetical protein HGRIS_013106 [Hohenbuehelia grisea]|uniref:OTU domain-containing protein n=1 Tax=Hohenbuehelia grisea TaxID=104357 RepID=A0ABR3IUE4_9AGAR
MLQLGCTPHFSQTDMAGSKRNKIKKAPLPPPPSTDDFDDDELMGDLMAQLDSKDQTVQAESATVLNEMHINKQAEQIEASKKKDSKSKFMARQARKAVALAEKFAPEDKEADARLEREAREEEKAINRICDQLNMQMYEINPDGHCLFSAVADQLSLLNVIPSSQANYLTVRRKAADYILLHPDDFLPFLPSPGGEDGAGAHNDGLMTPAEFESYCRSIRDTAVWGGEPEILALSRAYQIPIHVIQGTAPPIVEHQPHPEAKGDGRVVRISYHRRMYGLGEHYNSLRPKTGLSQISSSIQAILS